MDEVRICPMDTDGRYHPPDVKDCPNCAVEMESYHRRRTDQEEGMELDGGSFWEDLAIVVAILVIVFGLTCLVVVVTG